MAEEDDISQWTEANDTTEIDRVIGHNLDGKARAIKVDKLASKAALDALAGRVSALETIEIATLSVDGGSIYEKGLSVTPTLNWTIDGAGTVTEQVINGNIVAPEARTWTAAAAITANTTYTLTVTDASDRDVSDSVSISFRPRIYWGMSDALVMDSAGVLALESGSSALSASRGRTMTMAPDGEQYFYYAYPTSFGQPSSVTAYGFPTDPVVTTISMTTAAGNTEDYYLVRLPELLTQSGTVVVS
ncbi:hypothetical protein [uncultured Martelella sp.]|uniref:hypothetical protein n=1 Tax=uncultured Martelella sp. TaxID=392331 RepID=UPI0029C6B76D|nr:hypothetical protein [uncultured Martelella sp.]